MNEYLTTFLAEDHRRELLAEARADALAREALAGRPSWWHRLLHRVGRRAAEAGGDVGEAASRPRPGDASHRPHAELSDAQHRHMVLSVGQLGRDEVTTCV